MEDFYREFRTKLVHEMGRIQSSLKELKVLVEEDKRLLERLRKKRSMKAEQREELLMEREIIERMHGYTSKITALAAQKEALKQEIMRKYQKKILLDLMEMDDQQEQLKLLDEMHIKAKEKAKVKEIEEKRRIMQDSRLKKLARTFTPVKSKAPEATNSKIKSKTPVHQQESTYSRSGTKSRVANFSTKHVKEEMAKKIEEKKKKVRESLAIADTNQKHSDHMYKRALKNYYGMEEVRFEMKSKREREEVASVTFHPHINDKSRKIARNIPPFKERAYDKIEADRLKAINERSKSYMKGKGITDSSASEFKMGKEYHAHMYTKTMKWEIARRTALDSKREKETQYPDEDIRDRPKVMLKKSKEILAQKDLADSGNDEQVHDRLYNQRLSLIQRKSVLKKHYDEIYSPFKPMINHSPADTRSPRRLSLSPGNNSDEILKGLLTEIDEGNNSRAENLAVQTILVPRHQKEILKDIIVVGRYES